MVYMIFDKCMTEEEAAQKVNRKYIEYPDGEFEVLARDHDLNTDEIFIRALKEIDRCDIPMRNVARDLLTGDTHSFDKVSTGVRVIWLMARYPDKFLFPTQWLGENCYQMMFDIGKEFDFYVYEDSDMFSQDGVEDCTGYFTDLVTGEEVCVDNDNGFEYMADHLY